MRISIPIPAICLALCRSSLAAPLDDVPPSAEVVEDTGQVTINDDPTANTTVVPDLPITATVFTGVPGPSHCRGGVMLRVSIPHDATRPKCIGMPKPAGCAVFSANKKDGCQARLFAEPGCRMFVNTAVFLPEERAVGGLWRSMEVRCGVPEPDPESLGEPPLAGLLEGATRRPRPGL
ncbi:hypothetical protein OQA88_12531 [Cercophora sp. LCS_1]